MVTIYRTVVFSLVMDCNILNTHDLYSIHLNFYEQLATTYQDME